MKTAFGWVVPGGAYLLNRRYKEFVLCFLLVSTVFAVGVALDGMSQPPQSDATAMIGKGAEALAGFPCLFATFFIHSPLAITAPVHEYGATLLMAAGLINLLVLASRLWCNVISRRTQMPRLQIPTLTIAPGRVPEGVFRVCPTPGFGCQELILPQRALHHGLLGDAECLILCLLCCWRL